MTGQGVVKLPGARSNDPAASVRSYGAIGLSALAVLVILGLSWAKWIPYTDKLNTLGATYTWPGGAIFSSSGKAGAPPTFWGAWHFTVAYFESVWKAAAVGLVLAAGVDALVPKAWLRQAMNRRTRLGQALVGGTASVPSMMCTCCTAPLVVSLRRGGAATSSTLAYWVGNPVLNPAVLAFLFLVAPWQFGVVRIFVGVALVFGATALIARMSDRSDFEAERNRAELPRTSSSEPVRLRELPIRFLKSLMRFSVILVPEYFVVVLIVGGLSGWLSSFDSVDARLGIAAVVFATIIGTLLVIPTGGEIPVVLALAAAGANAGTIGALLITLPALSVPSMVMVSRALSWRVTVGMAAAVALCGGLAAALLWAIW